MGRHIPLIDWCVNCTFGKYSIIEFTPKCSKGIVKEVAVDNDQELASLPFLSSAAALLILIELLKLQYGHQTDESLIQYNFMNFGQFMSFRKRNGNCTICKNQSSQLYLNLIQDTKYAGLSKI